ncbi:MAG: hypothetical protein LKM44_02280 [Wolbachia endosymbiont of Meromenopon meropis]|nr:hypothetical protein [Wolbachia endosymbiont of Meromenopon meropis]
MKKISIRKKVIKQYSQEYLNFLEKFLAKINEEIDNLDSYERIMQLKRSIDRLIEILYSQATFEDINVEFVTMKNIRNRSESKKRVIKKRKKQIMEEVLSGVFAQQQKELINLKHLSNRNKIIQHENMHELKKQIKFSIKEVLFVIIAHRMDPRRRAGETIDDNKKQAHIHGRKTVGGGILLLSVFLNASLFTVTNAIHEYIKLPQYIGKQKVSFTKQIEEDRKTDSEISRYM